MVPVRFFKNRAGQRIAYADEGAGPLIVLPAWWVSHLERDADEPAYARFFSRLSSRFRVVRYDRVGAGMSDRVRSAFTMESELSDFAALVEHLGAEQFHLLGCSCAGPIALAYAAENPARVERMVLYGTYLHGAELSRDEVRVALVSLVRADGRLGSRTLADIFYPNADAAARGRFNALTRSSADPETAARLLELTYALDARSFAERVHIPVLVLHRQHDRAVRYEMGRALAASLPNATLSTLDGVSHMPWHEEGDAVVDAICSFLERGRALPPTTAPIEDALLRREGEVWRLRFDGRQVLLRDSKGLADLARLLGHPDDPVHVLDLLGEEPVERRDAARGDVTLDHAALEALRRRLRDLDEAIDDAEANADLGRRRQLTEERATLIDQLARDTGLGGRPRRLNDPIERARKAVTARLRDAIRRVKEADPATGAHLEESVETGTTCVYRPGRSIHWAV
jgi:pimeloyl-ACP methyl ester carboxylesterase